MPARKKKRAAATTGKLGQVRQFLVDNFSMDEDSLVCLSGHVLVLYHDLDKSVLKTIREINQIFGFEPSYSQIVNLVRRASGPISQFYRSGKDSLEKICKEIFVFQYPPLQKAAPTNTSGPSAPHETPASPLPASPEAPGRPPAQADTYCCLATPHSSAPHAFCLTDPGPSRSSDSPIRLHRLRNDHLTPREKAMKRRLTFLASDMASKAKKHRADRIQFKEKLASIKSKPYKFKRLNQTIARKEKIIRQLRSTLREQPAIAQLQKVQAERNRLKRKLASAKIRYKSKLSHHPSVFRQQLADRDAEKDAFIKTLQNDIKALEEEVKLKNEEQHVKTAEMDNKTYSPDMRMLIYDAVVNQVPTQNIPTLISTFSKRLGVTLTSVPDRTTVERMVGVISDLQTAEVIMTTDNLTLGFDSTTQEGVHVNSN